MGEKTSFQLGVMGALFLSVASSVSIVICNKALMSNLGFPFATTLTSWHLMVTFVTLHVALKFNLFENKHGYEDCDSLWYLKWHFHWLSQSQPCRNVNFSLLILLLGVGIASITDLQLNFVGTILSLLAILTTCVGQILTDTIQKRLHISSTQLLYQSAPFQAGILFVTGPLVDQFLTNKNVFAHNYSNLVLGFILLSCLIAVSVNFSTFLVIGKTSPVTYQVLGHLKTCLVLGFGYTLLHDPFTLRNIVGILVAIVGMGLYSYFCTHETKKKQPGDHSSNLQVKEKDTSTPLLGGKDDYQDKENHESKKLSKDLLV
ncbi:hypothetical protein R3W88_016266 [Solanum pinnatisectum]|uniref:Sugar phosphate transporter domain-containing protein n=1 Tax=Solanum pinnatisectum TaxID=50273 RepID=A0AAV9KY96_9SOLN|nr:hypothetical protein R3W88_016266 [Solanum pinnatisectum]